MTKNDLRSSTANPNIPVDWTFNLTQNGKPTGEQHVMPNAEIGTAFARLAKERWIEENRARPKPEPGLTDAQRTLVENEFREWLRGPIELEHPQHSVAHRILPQDLPLEVHVMLVQHDWARLMARATITGPEDDNPPIPYPVTVFEFAFKGSIRFIVLATEGEHSTMSAQYIKTKSGWTKLTIEKNMIKVPVSFTSPMGMALRRAVEIVGANIKAICAMLEAEVVEATPTRMPYKRNEPKDPKAPSTGISHHIVSLANRRRVAPLHGPNHEPGHHKRLHFRRGHWRHYETHKTWIKWTLVGNPDLGFVDKEYTL